MDKEEEEGKDGDGGTTIPAVVVTKSSDLSTLGTSGEIIVDAHHSNSGGGDSTGSRATTTRRTSSSRTRQNSIKNFTDKVRLFSNDFLRTIENAHEMVDLKNSNFSAATQSAAAQLCQHQHEESHSNVGTKIDDDDDDYDDVYYKNEPPPPIKSTETVDIQDPPAAPAAQSHKPKFLRSDSILRGVKSIGKEFSKAIDQANAINEYITPSNQIRNSMEPPAATTLPASLPPPLPPLPGASSRGVSFQDNTLVIESNGLAASTTLQPPSPLLLVIAQPSESATTSAPTQSVEMKQQQKAAQPPPKTTGGQDQTDFRVKRRQRILRNGLKIAIPDEIHISIFEVFIYMWGVVTFFADLISDIILSVEYYNGGREWLGTMTLMFVIVPNVTLSLFSLSWYIDNYYSEQAQQHQSTSSGDSSSRTHGGGKKNRFRTTCDSITFWITTILFVTFQLDLIWKYIQGLVYTIKGWACRSLFHNLDWEKYYIEKQIKCDTDIGMLRLIDVYLDSGPQILLQLYVITTQNLNELGSANLVVFTFKDFQTTSVELKQLVSILSSLFSMAYAVAGYHRCLRNQQFIFCLQTNKPLPKPMSWPSTITQFLWYLSLIAPRVLAMALFASTFRSWFFMIIFTHWLVMYFWILRLKTNYCISSPDVYNAREEIFEKFYDFVCSFIYIFVYFNLKAGRTRYRYLIYYLLFYAENILFVTCYFIFSKDSNHVYKLVVLLVVCVGFWLALTFQIVYYLYCHPSQEITVCVRHKAKFQFIHNETLKPRRRPPSSTSNQQAAQHNEFHSPNGVDLCDYRPRRDQQDLLNPNSQSVD